MFVAISPSSKMSRRALFVFAFISLVFGPRFSVSALTTPLHKGYLQPDSYASAAQVVFNGQQQFLESTAPFNYSEWDFSQGPALNATGNLVFDTVRSLLQHWPNTRYRNGHTIIAGTIPPGTLLYHGTFKHVVPTIPEWTATDPEHSYLFCRQPPPGGRFPPPTATVTAIPNPWPTPTAETRSIGGQHGVDTEDTEEGGCWHLTLGTTRSLRVLYFDGSSAAKMRGGPMDTQDLLAWGKVNETKVFAERERIDNLCRWGKEFGIDGFVRMEMDFEVMLCDFTAGLEVVSFLNLAPVVHRQRPRRPDTPSPSPLPGSPRDKYDIDKHTRIKMQALPQRVGPDTRVLEAGSWHNTYPGETRVALDYTRLISLYDTELFPGLVRAREGVPRLKHRVGGMDKKDLEVFSRRLAEAAAGGNDNAHINGSGIDWRTLFHTIAERYAARLERLPYILNVTGVEAKEEEARERSAQAYRAVSSMLAPYVIYSAVPPAFNISHNSDESLAENAKHEWAAPVWANCALAHTNALVRPALETRMTASERLLLRAAREVEREICRVLVGVWAEGSELGLEGEENEDDWLRVGSDEENVSYVVLAAKWRERVERLMRWLDWSVEWLKCRPACSFEEMCVLPTWPYFNRPMLPGSEEEPENDWEDPQPRCMSVLEPMEGVVQEDEL